MHALRLTAKDVIPISFDKKSCLKKYWHYGNIIAYPNILCVCVRTKYMYMYMTVYMYTYLNFWLAACPDAHKKVFKTLIIFYAHI